MVRIQKPSRYTDVFILGRELRGTVGFLKTERLDDQIIGVKVNSFSRDGKLTTALGGIAGGIVAGALGILVTMTAMRPRIEATLTIYLRNGDYIKLDTDDVSLIKYLLPYMETK